MLYDVDIYSISSTNIMYIASIHMYTLGWRVAAVCMKVEVEVSCTEKKKGQAEVSCAEKKKKS